MKSVNDSPLKMPTGSNVSFPSTKTKPSQGCLAVPQMFQGHPPGSAQISAVAAAAAASYQEWKTARNVKHRNRRAAIRKYVRDGDAVCSVVGTCTGEETAVKGSTQLLRLFVSAGQKPCSSNALKGFLDAKQIRQVHVRETSKESWTKASFCV